MENTQTKVTTSEGQTVQSRCHAGSNKHDCTPSSAETTEVPSTTVSAKAESSSVGASQSMDVEAESTQATSNETPV